MLSHAAILISLLLGRNISHKQRMQAKFFELLRPNCMDFHLDSLPHATQKCYSYSTISLFMENYIKMINETVSGQIVQQS